MRLVAFGDIHMALEKLSTVPDLAGADLVIITGDLTNFGSRDDAATVMTAVQKVNRRVLALPGNLDKPEVAAYLDGLGISLHGTGRIVDGVGFFGVGGSNPTPFQTPIEFPDEELARLLTAGHAQVATATTMIMVSHAPPFHTVTDRLGNGAHVGSRAVRAFIEAQQPALCLTGHIHEARGEDRLGSTRIINPGMLKDGGWVEVLIDNGVVTATLNNVQH